MIFFFLASASYFVSSKLEALDNEILIDDCQGCSSTRILIVILSYHFVFCIISLIYITSLNYYFIHVDSYGYNSRLYVYT